MRGEMHVIPILLRPGDMKDTPFAHLRLLPSNGIPVSLWINEDQAFADIVERIRDVIEGGSLPIRMKGISQVKNTVSSSNQVGNSGPVWQQTQIVKSHFRMFWIISIIFLLLVGSIVFTFNLFNTFQITPTPQIIPTPQKDPYLQTGTLVLNDSLNGSSNKYQWIRDNNFFGVGSCNFKEQSYQLILLIQTSQTFYCQSKAQSFRDFVYQINITLINSTGGGIIFRLNSQKDFFYFGINASGEYLLSEVIQGQVKLLVPNKRSPLIKSALGQENIIAVAVNGTKIIMYINKNRVAETTVNNYEEGYIGVAVVDSNKTPGQVKYTDAEVWNLDQP